MHAPGNHLHGKGGLCGQQVAQDRRIQRGSQGIDVMQHDIAQAGALFEQTREHSAPKQVRYLIPVADRVQALHRQVIRIVATLAHALRPGDQGSVEALPNLLGLFVQHLL